MLPILTRYYTPVEFGYLASFVAVIAICSSAAGLRYEVAIPLPKTKKVALSLLVLSTIASLILALLSTVFIFIFDTYLNDITGLKGWLILLIPVGILSSALFNIFQYWYTRERAFGIIAKTKVKQSIIGNSVQLYGGVKELTFGLILGHLFLSSAGVLAFLVNLLKKEYKAIKCIKYKNIKFAAKRYSVYPRFSTLDVLANNAGLHLPILIITSFTVSSEAGFLLLAMKVMQAPMSLIGGSISQVFYSEIASVDSQNKRSEICSKVLSILIKVGFGPILFVGIIAQPIFGLVFGQDWARAGLLVTWCSLWFAFQFISSPISMIMHVMQKQKEMLILTTLGGVFRVVVVFFFALYSSTYVSEAFAVTGAFYYLICLIIFSKHADLNFKDLFYLFVINIKHLVAWLALGLLVLRFTGGYLDA
ncbi:lipopolysaccharide biosynthesis protein [Pseudidiomarina sp. E22-M8]|uniref:lipopolysaccharide biosynthesis protein n=1 Tax=Pseudidiomarina sp. E22-M8 TaxID=3424768 RepID=UPI00403C5BEB